MKERALIYGLSAVYGALLLCAAGTDLCRHRIFRWNTHLLLGISACLLLALSWTREEGFIRSAVSGLTGASVFFSLLFLITLIRPQAFGAGDLRLCFTAFLPLGIETSFLSFAVSIESATVFVILYRIGKGSVPARLPFGPFLALGAMTGLAVILKNAIM